jgi:hypothetical protein
MPAKKRRNEGDPNGYDEPQPKRRSARQAVQNGPKRGSVSDAGEKEEPRKAVKARNGSEKRGRGRVPQPGASKRESESGESESASTDPAKPKTTRAVSQDPEVNSIPDRNPEVVRHEGEWYWLMKAEPESRFENGIDVKFSIDDLRRRPEPEPWDGKRIEEMLDLQHVQSVANILSR